MVLKVRLHLKTGTKPRMVYDSECGFCRFWVRRWVKATRGNVDFIPSQRAFRLFPRLPRHEMARSLLLIEPNGKVYSGSEAVFRSLSRVPGRGVWLALYSSLPGFGPASEIVYGLIARHRKTLSRLAHHVPFGQP